MKLAAIGYQAGDGGKVDALLRQVAEQLRADGYRLAGAVQWNTENASQSKCDMVLEDLATGKRLDVSADQRGDPHACRLDTYALETVAGLVAGSIGPDVDLVILNRFGKQEAAKAGFRAVIEAAVANDLPVLTGLNAMHKELWERFTGAQSADIAPDADAVRAWCAKTLPERRKTA